MNKVLLILLILTANIAYAQRMVSGLVTDQDGKPIENVTVNTNNYDTKVETDVLGMYSIKIPKNCKTLEFSKSGFKVQIIEITDDIIDLTLTSLADVDVYELSLEELMQLQVISVASTKATTIFNTPSTVSVIDAQMLQQYNFSSVSDAIRIVSGISVLQSTLRKEIPTSRSILQDHYSNKILIMINGIPSWNPITGECGSLNRTNISDVERIEILKGPASVLYGTNAYSGAVNIVLKNNSANNNGQFSGSIGNSKTIASGVNISHKINDFSLFVAANTKHEQGDKRFMYDRDSISGYYDDFINWNNVSTVVQYKKHTFTFNAYNEEQQKLGVDLYFSTGLGKHQTLTGYLANYSNEIKLSDKLQLFSGIGFDWQARKFPRTQDFSILTNIQGWRANTFAKALYAINQNFNFELGTDCDYRKSEEYRIYNVLKDSTLTESNLKMKSVTEYSVFGQLGYKYSFVNLLLGTRYTENQYFGNNLSNRSTFLFTINKTNSLKLIFGQSFRAPSMFEVNFVNPTKTVSGNLNLKPEKCNSYEITYQTLFGNLYIQALVYYSEYKNKIFRVTQPFCILPNGETGIAKTRKYINGDQFVAKGVELESKYFISNFNIFLNYNYVEGNKGDMAGTDNAYNFKYIPHHTLSSGFFYTIKSFSLSSVTSYMSESIGGLSKKIKAQYATDINFGLNHIMSASSVKHTISVKNMFDAKLVTPEYVDAGFNEIPLGNQRRILYTLTIGF